MINFGLILVGWRDGYLCVEFEDTVPCRLILNADGFWEAIPRYKEWFFNWVNS
jgi:hypothetical protein